jgi:putative flippase GtrA
MELRSDLMVRFIKFTLVEFICNIIDFTALFAFTEAIGFSYLISNILACTLSVLLSSIMSLGGIFSYSENKTKDFIMYYVLGAFSLALSELILMIGVQSFNMSYILIKCIALGVCFIFNYISRLLFFEIL